MSSDIWLTRSHEARIAELAVRMVQCYEGVIEPCGECHGAGECTRHWELGDYIRPLLERHRLAQLEALMGAGETVTTMTDEVWDSLPGDPPHLVIPSSALEALSDG